MKISKLINNKSLQKKIFSYDPTHFQTINPVNNRLIKEYKFDTHEEVQKMLENSSKSFKEWRHKPLDYRLSKMSNLATKLQQEKDKLAKVMTTEMGKNITESKAEIDKVITHIKYYIDNSEKFLLNKTQVNFDKFENYIDKQPLGPILSIVPWNYPAWVAMKSIIPILVAGNTVVMKPAANIPESSRVIEEIFRDSGFDNYEFQVTFSSGEMSDTLLVPDKRVKAVVFTGSTRVGGLVAEKAGKHVKKAFLELGGSDPFIVLKDADLDKAVVAAAEGRLRNSGQACICAKRTIIHEDIFDKFVDKLLVEVDKYKMGDPTNPDNKVGPLARFDLFMNINKQVLETLDMKGAELINANYEDVDKTYEITDGNFMKPLLVKNIQKDTPMYKEEIFGPVFSLYKFKTDEEAIKLANDTEYGLGASVFTENMENAEIYKKEVDCGMLFINSGTVSDSRLPYGGTKDSGFGRTSAWTAFNEFSNNKIISKKI